MYVFGLTQRLQGRALRAPVRTAIPVPVAVRSVTTSDLDHSRGENARQLSQLVRTKSGTKTRRQTTQARSIPTAKSGHQSVTGETASAKNTSPVTPPGHVSLPSLSAPSRDRARVGPSSASPSAARPARVTSEELAASRRRLSVTSAGPPRRRRRRRRWMTSDGTGRTPPPLWARPVQPHPLP